MNRRLVSLSMVFFFALLSSGLRAEVKEWYFPIKKLGVSPPEWGLRCDSNIQHSKIHHCLYPDSPFEAGKKMLGMGYYNAFNSGIMDQESARAFCEALVYHGHDDWRLASASEVKGLLGSCRNSEMYGKPVIQCSSCGDTKKCAAKAGLLDVTGGPTATIRVPFWLGGTHIVRGKPTMYYIAQFATGIIAMITDRAKGGFPLCVR